MYEPELGQILFGTYQEFEASPAVEMALNMLGSLIEAKRGENPCNNSAERFKNDTFEMNAYDWSGEQEWNFAWKDVRISWYKYVGRGLSANMHIDDKMALDMFHDCYMSLKGG